MSTCICISLSSQSTRAYAFTCAVCVLYCITCGLTTLGQHGVHSPASSREQSTEDGGGEASIRGHGPKGQRKTTADEDGSTGQVPEGGPLKCVCEMFAS